MSNPQHLHNVANSNEVDKSIKAVVIVKDTVSRLEKLWNLFSKTLLGCLCCIICLRVLRDVGSLLGWGFSVKVSDVADLEIIMAYILLVFSFYIFNLFLIKRKTLLLELVSAELADPTTKQKKATIKGCARRTRTVLKKAAIIKEHAHRINGDGKYEKYECDLVIPGGFGEVGALIVENDQCHEKFLEDILLCDFPHGPVWVMIACRSWVHSKSENPEKRIFFTNKVDELDKSISVAARDSAWFGIDEVELEKRRRWTSTARTQVGTMKKAVVAGKELSGTGTTNVNGLRRELMRLPNSHQTDRSSQFSAQYDDFISSESDRQLLLIKYFPSLYLVNGVTRAS